ncbi:MAG: flagellar protein FlaG [Bradyrhizobium canariense]
MDTGSIARIPAANAPSTAPRPDVVNSARGVTAELPADATVQQVGAAEVVHFDPSGADVGTALDGLLSEFIKRNIEIPETREIVLQVVDRDTGRVIRQTPDEAILRLRVYIRELRAAEERNAALRVEKII